jgi:ribosomal protein L24
MAISKIQTGDKVKITAGSHAGHVGIIKKIVKKVKGKRLQTRVTISGLKKITKYRRAFNYAGQSYPGAMTQVDRTVDISNVRILDEKDKPTRVEIKTSDDGKKYRVYKTTQSKVTKHEVPQEISSLEETQTN